MGKLLGQDISFYPEANKKVANNEDSEQND